MIIVYGLSDPAFWSRFQLGFTLTYHYRFPQLTKELAWFMVYWKWRALKTGDEKYNRANRFWPNFVGSISPSASSLESLSSAGKS